MKKRNLIPVAVLAASFALVSCDDDNDDNNENNTSPQCGITITSADAPQTNDAFILLDADQGSLDVDSLLDIEGVDKTWDFSDIVSNNDGDTMVFAAASTGTNSSSYPNADFVFADGDEEIYIQTTPTGLDIIGMEFDSDEDVETEVTNGFSYIPYSLEMNKVLLDEFVIEATMHDTIDTVVSGFQFNDVPVVIDVEQTVTNEFTVDGCGTVITPSGQYDCLRYIVEPGTPEASGTVSGNHASFGGPFSFAIPDEELEADADLNLFSNTTYFWISKDSKMPVLIVEIDDLGDVSSVQYLK